jgi:subtilisin family serine protease
MGLALVCLTGTAVAVYTGNLSLLFDEKNDEPKFDTSITLGYTLPTKIAMNVEGEWVRERDPNLTQLRDWQMVFKIGDLLQWKVDPRAVWDPSFLAFALVMKMWQEDAQLNMLSYLYWQEDSCPYCRFYNMVDDWYDGYISNNEFNKLVDELAKYYGDGPWNYASEYEPYYSSDESSLCEPPYYFEGGLKIASEFNTNGVYYIPGTDQTVKLGDIYRPGDGYGSLRDFPLSRTTIFYNKDAFSQRMPVVLREGDNRVGFSTWSLERNVISGTSVNINYIKDDGWRDLNYTKVGNDGWGLRTGLSYKLGYNWTVGANYTIEKDPTFTAAVTPNDPYFSAKGTWKQNYADQWALQRIGFKPLEDSASAWNITTGAERPVTVAVIDSGIDLTHPDLHIDNIWINEKERGGNHRDDDGNGYIDDLIGWNFVQNNNNPFDFAGHGTHVAGIIAARWNNGRGIAGINRGARIMPLKALNEIGKGWGSDIARAVVYAVDNGAKIINISAEHSGHTKFLEGAFAYAQKQGALIVVSAGNEASDTRSVEPANQPGVIVVAATLPNDKRVGFSNWGEKVNVAAPGVDVLSLRAANTDLVRKISVDPAKNKPGESVVGKDEKYYRATGTSFAAPLVTGVASLMLAKNPNLTAEQIKKMLMMSADDVEAPGWDPLTGYGIVNARKALEADPNYYLLTELHRIAAARDGGRTVLQVFGTVEGSDWSDSHLEVGQGDNPSEWKQVGQVTGKPVKEGMIGTLTPQDFGSGGRWTIRVVARDRKGFTRESRTSFNLQ